MSAAALNMSYGFTFDSLQDPQQLLRLDAVFIEYLQQQSTETHQQLLQYRAGQLADIAAVDQLLLDCAPFVEAFIACLYNIEDAVQQLQAETLQHDPLFKFKQEYVLGRAKRRIRQMHSAEDALAPLADFKVLNQWVQQQLLEANLLEVDEELAIAQLGIGYLSAEQPPQAAIDRLVDWCVQALQQPHGQCAVQGWVTFQFPKRMDYQQLIPMEAAGDGSAGSTDNLRLQLSPTARVHREGFGLTDAGMGRRAVMNEIDYCLYCHDKQSDFCSTGFPVKKKDRTQGLRREPLGEWATGCPLHEKISQMHVLKKSGYSIAALAVVMIDNPLCALTGHRICNDCMKSCIYQKQQAVDIPQVETQVLIDVLHLPWGIEIYDLLMRWNPLRVQQWVAKPYNGYKIVVMGMGPAGITVAHHLLMEGCAVVGMDGVKIEPLPACWLRQPIARYQAIVEALDQRIVWGFGGVAEYGITVRWDKNFLKLIYLLLARRPYFQVFGTVRFGGTLTVEKAWDLGFDHLVIAVGAGLPKELPIPYSLAPGMVHASDFLMALQLSGAAKDDSVASLQVHLPALIIGGGLTAVDTATEVQAYYVVQITKNLHRFEHLVAAWGEQRVWEIFSPRARTLLHVQLEHARQLRGMRNDFSTKQQAGATAFTPALNALVRSWGGVTIVYRQSMQQSPAYRLNHQELMHALAQGIYYLECLQPVAVQLDDTHGQVSGLVCSPVSKSTSTVAGNKQDTLAINGPEAKQQQAVIIPALSILVATGAKPNVAYEFEHAGTFKRTADYLYQTYAIQQQRFVPIHFDDKDHCKVQLNAPFTSYQQAGGGPQRVSCLGDTHPLFHGSVVKAIASGYYSYGPIMQHLSAIKAKASPSSALYRSYQVFKQRLQRDCSATVVHVGQVGEMGLCLVVRAPLAAQCYQLGQFYRLQVYETQVSQRSESHGLYGDPLAVWPAIVDKAVGEITFYLDCSAVGVALLRQLQREEPVALMGPTGARIKISTAAHNLLFIGDRRSLLIVPAIAKALRAQGHAVYCVFCIDSAQVLRDLGVQALLQSVSDAIIWVVRQQQDDGDTIVSQRTGDGSWQCDDMGVVLQRLLDTTALPDGFAPLSTYKHLQVIGDSRLLHWVQQACGSKGVWATALHKQAVVLGSVHGPMQCMLKGVCAQCLQWQVDPKTGQRTKAVYGCSWQDQPLDCIDITHLQERNQNGAMARCLNDIWARYVVDKCLAAANPGS